MLLESEEALMAEALQVPLRRVITPVTVALMLMALGAALLLGFGLRAWTESSPKPPAPVVVSVPSVATPPTYECKMGRPC
jgi:hypothetical protein